MFKITRHNYNKDMRMSVMLPLFMKGQNEWQARTNAWIRRQNFTQIQFFQIFL